MKIYVNPDAAGFPNGHFYEESVHGPRRLLVPDPTYVRRKIEMAQPDGGVILVDDSSDFPPLIDGGPNPDTKIPPDAVEITSEQYRDLLENVGRRKVQIVNGDMQVVEHTPPPPPLDQIKSAAASAIDFAAGAARARYITIAPGQEATYQIKAEQAAAYKSAGYPADASPWALIDLEAQATGSTPRDTADLVLATRDAWVQIAAQIEAARIGGKQAVAQAADGAAVDAARDTTLAALEVM